jgi:hypothetical protein
LPRGVGACIHTLPRVGRQFDHLAAPVLGRGGCPCVWTVRSQGSAVPTRGTFVVRDNRLANSVQTHLFRYRQCGSCRQARALDPALLRLARRGGGGRWRTLRATDARGGRASCAEQRTGEATYARGRKCENALELRGRAPADSPDRAMNGALRAAGAREVGLCPEDKHTGQKETALWARWGAHRERVDADA